MDNDTIDPNKDLDVLRIIYACIEATPEFNAIINQHSYDAFLQKNLTGSFKAVVRHMFANPTSQANLAAIQKALNSPSDLKPYDGPQLFIKK